MQLQEVLEKRRSVRNYLQKDFIDALSLKLTADDIQKIEDAFPTNKVQGVGMRNFSCLLGKYPQAYGNIATTKLIQWKTAKMRGNKPFHGFCGFIFLLFEPFFVVGAALFFAFVPLFNDSGQSLNFIAYH